MADYSGFGYLHPKGCACVCSCMLVTSTLACPSWPRSANRTLDMWRVSGAVSALKIECFHAATTLTQSEFHCILVDATIADPTNPACPNIYFTTGTPTVFVSRVMQDFYHQQYYSVFV